MEKIIEIQKLSPSTENKKYIIYAEKAIVAPWAKCINLFVKYIRENPEATREYIAPAMSPFIISCRSNDILIFHPLFFLYDNWKL